MRLMATLMLLIGLSTSVYGQDICNERLNPVGITGLATIADVRIDSILQEVAARAGFGSDELPILCSIEDTTVGPMAMTFPVFSLSRVGHAIALPTFLLKFDRQTLMGAIAHELAHVRRGVRTLTSVEEGVREEIMCDKLAAMWVGRDAAMAHLNMLSAEVVPRSPAIYRSLYIEQIETRKRAL